PGCEAVNPGRTRSQSRQYARSGGIAQRGLCMGICKNKSPFCEPIQVGCLDLRMPSQCPNPIVEVIDSNKQNIGLITCLRPDRRGTKTQTSNQAIFSDPFDALYKKTLCTEGYIPVCIPTTCTPSYQEHFPTSHKMTCPTVLGHAATEI